MRGVGLRCGARAIATAAVVVALSVNATYASGHGPVFGGATPTLGKGGGSSTRRWDRAEGPGGSGELCAA